MNGKNKWILKKGGQRKRKKDTFFVFSRENSTSLVFFQHFQSQKRNTHTCNLRKGEAGVNKTLGKRKKKQHCFDFQTRKKHSFLNILNPFFAFYFGKFKILKKFDLKFFFTSRRTSGDDKNEEMHR